MANSYVEYTTGGTGTNGLGQTTFSYSSVDVLNANDIKVFGVKLDGTKEELPINSRNATAKTVTLTQTPSAWASTYISKIRLYRSTTSNALIDFVDGARLTESDLDTAYKQGLFVAQEVSEDAGAIGTQLTNVTDLTLSGTTSVDNLTASGTVTIPSSTNLSVTNLTASGTVSLPNGSITTANRQALPFFSCKGYSIPDVQYVAAPNKIIRPTTTNLVNVGSHMDTSTGIFTVPTTGIYAAYIDICRNADNWISVSIQINQVKRTERQIPPMGGSNANWFYNRAEVVTQCNQGMEIAFTYNSNYLTPSAGLHAPEMGIYQIA